MSPAAQWSRSIHLVLRREDELAIKALLDWVLTTTRGHDDAGDSGTQGRYDAEQVKTVRSDCRVMVIHIIRYW